MLRIAVLLFSLFLLLGSAVIAYEGWKNPEPTRTTVADYVKSDKSKEWVVLTDAEIDLSEAVSVTGQIDGKVFKLYIPIRKIHTRIDELFTQDAVNLLLETKDEEILNVYRQLSAMSEAKRLQFLLENRPKLVRSVELSGLVSKNNMGNVREEQIRKHIENLASDFYILKHNQSYLGWKEGGLIMMGIGLFLLTFSLRGKKKAYENPSKPETRTADDSQSQPLKSPTPDRDESQVSHYQPPPLMQKHCLTCNAVIHRQAELCPHCGVLQTTPLPDKDKSQVSPYLSSPVSPTDAAKHTKEIELADRSTRLRAVINDVVTMGVPTVLLMLLYSGSKFYQVEEIKTAFVIATIVAGLYFIGVLMIDLVLLYRCGQTRGKRRFYIKIVKVDGSRAGLGTLLVRTVVTFGIILLLVAIFSTRGLAFPVIVCTLIILLDSLFIFQKSRRCLHDLIAKTIVVKVFPSKNDTACGAPTGAIGAIILKEVVPLGLVLVFVIMISTVYTDLLKYQKVSDAVRLLGGLKMLAEEYMADNGQFPPTIDVVTSKMSDRYAASLISNLVSNPASLVSNLVSNPEEFYFEATLSKKDGILGGKVLRLIYHPDTGMWSCSALYPNGIPQKYLPSACKE